VWSDEFYCGSVKFEYEKESLKEIDHRWRVNSRIREFGSKSLKAYCELADQAKYHYTTIIRENKKASLERPNRLGIWYSKEHGWYNDDPNNPQTGFYQFLDVYDSLTQTLERHVKVFDYESKRGDRSPNVREVENYHYNRRLQLIDEHWKTIENTLLFPICNFAWEQGWSGWADSNRQGVACIESDECRHLRLVQDEPTWGPNSGLSYIREPNEAEKVNKCGTKIVRTVYLGENP